jgi:acyl-CoA hydrolase
MDKMGPKEWKESFTQIERLVMPADTNIFNALYGGRLMEWIDNIASIVAFKHCRQKTVTGSLDQLFFLAPIHLGYIVNLQGRINYVTRTTMEVEVDVTAQDAMSGKERFTTKAYLTYVAIDDDGKPSDVPQLITEDEDSVKRYKDGELRSIKRLELLKSVKEEVLKFNENH